jgi:hypothetical protein
VRGPFNNWGGAPGALVMTNSPDNESIFRGTLSVSNASPGNTMAYKFNRSGMWETGPDRTFVLASSAQTLPPRYFDDLGDLGLLSISYVLVFEEMDITVSWDVGRVCVFRPEAVSRPASGKMSPYRRTKVQTFTVLWPILIQSVGFIV